MRTTVTFDELEQLRARLAEFPEALDALNTIEDCDGDVEDAAISLAIQAGQEPDLSEGWLDGLAKRWRHVLCQPQMKGIMENGLSVDLLTLIAGNTALPVKLAIPVALHVLKVGIPDFCHSFDEGMVKRAG